MEGNAAPDDELNIVVVQGQSERAIVPSYRGDRLLPGPQGSVTLEGIRRAAGRVRDQQDVRNIGPIAQATLRPTTIGPGQGRR
jgi:hypothetical protein